MIVESKELLRFIKFAFVGVLNTVLNWVLFYILNLIGVYYLISNVIAYIISTLHSYLWNYLWVFKFKGKDKSKTTIKFILLNIFGLLINTMLLYTLVDIVGLYKLVALIITTFIVMIINYVINKIWVFTN